MGIVVIGDTFVDIKGFPEANYLPTGRNVGRVEYIHGGVARNVAEDIANIELRPTFVSIVDDTPLGADVVKKLRNHKVNTDYILTRRDGMGLWLAVFDNNGDVAGSISKRPDSYVLVDVLDQQGDEIFQNADSVVIEVDMHKDIVKKVFDLAEKHHVRVYALVSNMGIAIERRDFFRKLDCFICNRLEAGMLFLEDYSETSAEDMQAILLDKITRAEIPSMVVTLGGDGAVYADLKGNTGYCPAKKVHVKDTTGAGDAFCAGVVSGLTYGKTLAEAVEIGSTLAASVITSSENVCPRFQPAELGFDFPV